MLEAQAFRYAIRDITIARGTRSFSDVLKELWPDRGSDEQLADRLGREPTLTELAEDHGRRYWQTYLRTGKGRTTVPGIEDLFIDSPLLAMIPKVAS
jgi:hypothetical protein